MGEQNGPVLVAVGLLAILAILVATGMVGVGQTGAVTNVENVEQVGVTQHLAEISAKGIQASVREMKIAGRWLDTNRLLITTHVEANFISNHLEAPNAKALELYVTDADGNVNPALTDELRNLVAAKTPEIYLTREDPRKVGLSALQWGHVVRAPTVTEAQRLMGVVKNLPAPAAFQEVERWMIALEEAGTTPGSKSALIMKEIADWGAGNNCGPGLRWCEGQNVKIASEAAVLKREVDGQLHVEETLTNAVALRWAEPQMAQLAHTELTGQVEALSFMADANALDRWAQPSRWMDQRAQALTMEAPKAYATFAKARLASLYGTISLAFNLHSLAAGEEPFGVALIDKGSCLTDVFPQIPLSNCRDWSGYIGNKKIIRVSTPAEQFLLTELKRIMNEPTFANALTVLDSIIAANPSRYMDLQRAIVAFG